MSAGIIFSYWFVGRTILNIAEVRHQVAIAEMFKIDIYFLAAIYWSFINSYVEECVWQGFVYLQYRYT